MLTSEQNGIACVNYAKAHCRFDPYLVSQNSMIGMHLSVAVLTKYTHLEPKDKFRSANDYII
jgi:hypothetical protein